MIEGTDATSSGSEAGTPSNEDSSSDTSTVSSGSGNDSAKGRTEQSAAPEGDGEIDFESVPKELRPHVEKFAKKYEKDFKGAYTKKFQDLSAKEKLWEQERASYNTEREQWKNTAMEVLKDPKKLDAYRQLYNIPDPATTPDPDAIPENVQTVGDLLNWNKQQMQAQKESLRKELYQEASGIVKSTLDTQKWDSALKTKAADKHFAKYQDVIIEFAKKDKDLQLKYRSGLISEDQVLSLTQEKLKAMQREDMEEIKAQTLADQRKKAGATTATPTKTVATTQRAAQSKDEVIARVRAKLGSAHASQ